MRLVVANIMKDWPSFSSTRTCRVQQLGWPCWPGAHVREFQVSWQNWHLLFWASGSVSLHLTFSDLAHMSLDLADLNMSYQSSWVTCGFVQIARIIMIVLKASFGVLMLKTNYKPIYLI